MKSTRAHSLTSDPIDIKYAAKSGVVPPGSTDVKVKFKAPSQRAPRFCHFGGYKSARTHFTSA